MLITIFNHFWDSIPSKWTHLHGLSLFFIILCLFSRKNINIGMVIPCSTHVYWVAHHEIPIFWQIRRSHIISPEPQVASCCLTP